MLFAAEELVAPGGPSAPVWAFLTAISVGLIGVIAQQIAAKRQAREAKEQATLAAENAKAAQLNTNNVSNGFVGRVDRKLDSIQADVTETNKALRKHLEWHMENNDK
jgi:Tfp pilus assembly protein PilV